MSDASSNRLPDPVLASAYQTEHAIIRDTIERNSKIHHTSQLPRISDSTLAQSLGDTPFDVESLTEEVASKSKTVLYLAYGSNLSVEKFRKDRGIKPLAQLNVQIPALRMTFDLPGLPYAEPCFANTARRDPNDDGEGKGYDESSALLRKTRQKEKYRKNRWHKGLVGVVYEVTAQDYAHIIATEGGGSGYKDILVKCHAFESSDPREPVPQTPSTPPFKAHTLFAPAALDGDDPPSDGGRISRPDPDYAQASARYLKLITDGAAECALPYEYQDYLHSLRPYTITTAKQRIGQFVFMTTWVPLVMMVFAMGKMFVDKNGKLPKWMRELTAAMFKAVWASYDAFFRPLFGDGERTIYGEDEDQEDEIGQSATLQRLRHPKRSDVEKGSLR